MKKFIIILCILSAGLFFTAHSCSADGKIENQGLADFYKVSSGDILNIQVYEEADLSGAFEVKEDGTITYPLLGSVKVAGLTKSGVEKVITDLLEKDYLTKPYLHISITAYHQRNVLVLGCVQKPGSYPFPQDKDMSLLEAISLAGGFTGYASIGGTKIIRTSPEGRKVSVDPKMADIISGKRKDITLMPDDLVFIPERLF
jgi:polysaccharide export outer membrane protein